MSNQDNDTGRYKPQPGHAVHHKKVPGVWIVTHTFGDQKGAYLVNDLQLTVAATADQLDFLEDRSEEWDTLFRPFGYPKP